MELRLPAIERPWRRAAVSPDRPVQDGKSIYDIDFEFLRGAETATRWATACKLIDHLTHNVYRGRMAFWGGDFCERLFNFREIRYFDIKGEYTGLTSKAMTAPDGKIRIPLNEESQPGRRPDRGIPDAVQRRGHAAHRPDCLVATDLPAPWTSWPWLVCPDDARRTTCTTRCWKAACPATASRWRSCRAAASCWTALPQGGQARACCCRSSRHPARPGVLRVHPAQGDEGFGEGNFKALFDRWSATRCAVAHWKLHKPT